MLFCALGVYEAAPRVEAAEWRTHFIKACDRLDYVEYLVDTLIGGDSYEHTEVINMMLTNSKLKKLQDHLKKQRKERSYEKEER